jgi:BMFP domain-containing protein YqiC
VEDRVAQAEREALEWVLRAEAENTTVLASAREDVECFARKIALLEDKLATEHRAREVSEREH